MILIYCEARVILLVEKNRKNKKIVTPISEPKTPTKPSSLFSFPFYNYGHFRRQVLPPLRRHLRPISSNHKNCFRRQAKDISIPHTNSKTSHRSHFQVSLIKKKSLGKILVYCMKLWLIDLIILYFWRSPVEMSCVRVESMFPFHTATASALLTSMLSATPRSYGWTLEGIIIGCWTFYMWIHWFVDCEFYVWIVDQSLVYMYRVVWAVWFCLVIYEWNYVFSYWIFISFDILAFKSTGNCIKLLLESWDSH